MTRIRREADGVDRYNKPVFAEVSSELDVVGWAPLVSAEVDGIASRTLQYGGTLYLHPHSDVRTDDAFVVYGVRYEADGPKALWKHPSGHYPGDVLVVKRSEYVDA